MIGSTRVARWVALSALVVLMILLISARLRSREAQDDHRRQRPVGVGAPAAGPSLSGGATGRTIAPVLKA